MTWFASAGLDLDHTVGDLGDLEFEETLHQTGVSATHDDLRTLLRPAHFDDVGLHTRTRVGALVGHLLALRHEGFDLAEVEKCETAVGLLHDAGDDVAFAVGVLLVLALALGFPNALTHHLTESLSGDTTEFTLVGRVVTRVDPVAVLVDVVGGEGDLESVGVEAHFDFLGRPRTALVSRGQGIDEDLQEVVDRDVLLRRQQADGFGHVEVAHVGGTPG